ncbi:hypothetical protein KEM56_001865 [Ascosphaera pollenicola]|nr:hypothetical protein KEM56_001865 [Ascosphaera pollenicola]
MEQRSQLLTLPLNVINEISTSLGYYDLQNLRQTCRSLYSSHAINQMETRELIEQRPAMKMRLKCSEFSVPAKYSTLMDYTLRDTLERLAMRGQLKTMRLLLYIGVPFRRGFVGSNTEMALRGALRGRHINICKMLVREYRASLSLCKLESYYPSLSKNDLRGFFEGESPLTADEVKFDWPLQKSATYGNLYVTSVLLELGNPEIDECFDFMEERGVPAAAVVEDVFNVWAAEHPESLSTPRCYDPEVVSKVLLPKQSNGDLDDRQHFHRKIVGSGPVR